MFSASTILDGIHLAPCGKGSYGNLACNIPDRTENLSLPLRKTPWHRVCGPEFIQDTPCTGNTRTHHTVRLTPERSRKAPGKRSPQALTAGRSSVIDRYRAQLQRLTRQTYRLGHLPALSWQHRAATQSQGIGNPFPLYHDSTKRQRLPEKH